MLEIATPYMLREDGALLECGVKHPYLKTCVYKDTNPSQEDIDWFIDNTSNIMTKWLLLNKIDDNYWLDVCNDRVNSEFCRVRTSHLKFGGSNHSIYFRLGRVECLDYWLRLIEVIVKMNSDFIETINVCTDTQSTGGRLEYIEYNGVELKGLTTEEFLKIYE